MLDYYSFKEINDLFAHGHAAQGRQLLMELQSRYIAMRDEMETMKQQVQEFEDILYLSKNLVRVGDFYWLKIGSTRQGPFCPDCYQRDGALTRLECHKDLMCCPYCGSSYQRPPLKSTETAGKPADTAPRSSRIIQFAR
ncbi:MAG: hypothetical protein RRY29_05550 [Desulfovibrionaceae bacterium]